MKLASVERVVEVAPIPGADNIERVRVLGWDVVCKKGECVVGQLVGYIQIDTVVPEVEQFEFLRSRDFRVRTIKLKGQISQGLIVPINPPFDEADCWYNEGDDITEKLGVKKYSKPDANAPKNFEPVKVPKSKIGRIIHKIKYKYIYKLFPYFKPDRRIRADFPTNIVSKTDEERIQNISGKVFGEYKGKPFIGTEKLDGSSITLIRSKKRQKNGTQMRVCSRNMELFNTDNDYFQTAYYKGFGVYLDQLAHYFNTNNIVIQGEMIGKPQGNKYNLYNNQINVFNIFVDGIKLRQDETVDVCNSFRIPYCPVVFEGRFNFENLEELLKFAEGKSILNEKIEREGIVFRCLEDGLSFKVISNKFLLKNNE